MTGRSCLGEVLNQVWLKSVKKWDKQVNAQKENLKKYFQGSRKLLQAHEKVCNENERNKKKRHTLKNGIHGRKSFLMPIPKTGESNLLKLRVNDCRYNEGTICLVNR